MAEVPAEHAQPDVEERKPPVFGCAFWRCRQRAQLLKRDLTTLSYLMKVPGAWQVAFMFLIASVIVFHIIAWCGGRYFLLGLGDEDHLPMPFVFLLSLAIVCFSVVSCYAVAPTISTPYLSSSGVYLVLQSPAAGLSLLLFLCFIQVLWGDASKLAQEGGPLWWHAHADSVLVPWLAGIIYTYMAASVSLLVAAAGGLAWLACRGAVRLGNQAAEQYQWWLVGISMVVAAVGMIRLVVRAYRRDAQYDPQLQPAAAAADSGESEAALNERLLRQCSDATAADMEEGASEHK